MGAAPPGGGPAGGPPAAAVPPAPHAALTSLRPASPMLARTVAALGVLGGLIALGLVIRIFATTGPGSTGMAIAALVIALAPVGGGALAWLHRFGAAAALLLVGAFGMLWLFRFDWASPDFTDYLIAAAFMPTAVGAVLAMAASRPVGASREFYRHRLVIRITHWINVLCIVILLMSGLQIFNAHPALYWGNESTFNDPALIMYAGTDANGNPTGVVRVFGRDFTTTGVLGLSENRGAMEPRGFPAWITLPSWRDLATGRLWHFAFAWLFVANGLIYLIYGLTSRHLRRDLVPGRSQWREFGHTVVQHALLRFPHGEEATVYNILQKLAYLGVVVLLILMVLTGLSMSPGVEAGYPWLIDLFGGRQSARTFHFICAALIVLFVLVHVVMVLISGVWNNLRSMVTGRYAIKEEPGEPAPASKV